MAALSQVTVSDLAVVKDDETVVDHLTKYAAHEAYHTGQLGILCQVLGK